METKRKLLVIDDDQLYSKALSTRLEYSGFAVTILSPEKINEVLQVIEDNQTELVLLDLVMPQTDGKEILKKIRSKYERSALPVIIVTGMDNSSDVSETFKLGANDYITKPLAVDVAIARIRAHLSQGDLDRELIRKKELEVLNAMVVSYCHELATPLCVLISEFSRLEQGQAEFYRTHLLTAQRTIDSLNKILNQIREVGQQPEIFFEDYSSSTKMVKIK